ncbi:hypothetical protein [Nocardioides sp. B-3]|uniref:hypothetical protein n=1 Tax=Nocardioides sp. B-3 TaxID=2895565 RepID=UPI0021535B6C|nr:hypothetical protein [Nocardioides sp. B-3]UUZ60601.1 hypothetical protein LP418_07030 [Nocardioides sp. B-3]
MLHARPAALSGQSALRAHEGPGKTSRDLTTIEVAIDQARTVVAPAGVRVRRIDRLSERAVEHRTPAAALRGRRHRRCGPRPHGHGGLVSPRRHGAVASLDRGPARRRGRIADAHSPSGVDEQRPHRHRGRHLLGARARLPRSRRPTARAAHGRASGAQQRRHPCGLPRHRARQRSDRRSSTAGSSTTAPRSATPISSETSTRRSTARARFCPGWGRVFDRTCETAGKVAALHRARGWLGVPTSCGLPDCGLDVAG